jgi:pimeloyl-ACP methyl ester carboxylesterase
MKFRKIIVFVALFGLVAGIGGPYLIRSYNPWWSSSAKQYKDLAGYYNQKLNWRSCFGEFECANLSVPLDYSNLRKPAIHIAVIKLPAKNKQGSLVVNPGGPGASGVDYAYGKTDVVGREVLNNFDLVGFDPRGVARSAPIDCLTDKETDAYYASIIETEKSAKAFAEKCLAKNPNLKFMSTENVARDLDVLRSALGEKKLNFLGSSYGTYIGTLYLDLFPKSAGRFVLDGAIDPSVSGEAQIVDQAKGFDALVTGYEKYSGSSLINYFNNFKNVKGKDGRILTESLALYAVAAAMYEPNKGFPKLKAAFADYEKGNPGKLFELADAYTGRKSDGSYYSNEAESLDVITCLDWPNSGKVINTGNSFFGKYLNSSNLVCKYLPKAKRITLSFEKNDVLIVNPTNDPATPYKWAVGLNKLLPGSKLISLKSNGHTGHNRGSKCVDSAVNNFLINGQIPQENLTCSLN